MPTFNHIGGAEPSTLTFKLATVVQVRNSSNMHQEIMALGDPDTSNAIAAVLNAVPASTAWGVVTRSVGAVTIQGNSTVVVSGPVSIQGNSTVIQGTSPWVVGFQAGNISSGAQSGASSGLTVRPVWSSSNADQPVSATQGTSPWVVGFQAGNISSAAQSGASSGLTVRPVWSSSNADQPVSAVQSGNWKVGPSDTNWASSAGFHFDSSGGLQIGGNLTGSTTVNVSSLAGRVTTAPSDTNWASSAGFHFDSSGFLNVNASFSGSTIVTVSTGSVSVSPASTAATFYVPVRLTDGSAFIPPGTEYVELSTSGTSTASGVAIMWRDSSGAMHPVDPTRALPVALSSLAGRVTVAPTDTNFASSAGFHFDSSGALQVTGISASAVDYKSGSSQTWSTVTGPVTMGRASSATPASIGADDDVVPLWLSMQGALNVILRDSTGGLTNAGSTQVAVSSLAGRVTIAPTDTNFASSAGFHFDSSGALQVTGISASAVDYKAGSSQTWSTVTGPVCMARASSATPATIGADDDVVSLWASMQGALNVILRDSTGGLLTSTTVTATFPAGYISSAVQAGGSSALTVRNVWSSSSVDQPVRAVLSSTNTDNKVQTFTNDGSGNSIASATVGASSATGSLRGLAMRLCVPDSTTAVGSVATASSGNVTLISSAATSIYVYAYNIVGQSTADITVRLMSGSTNEVWRLTLNCGSTGAITAGTVDRDSMQVGQPSYLFRTAAGAALTYEKGASTTANGLVSYSFGFWRE